MAESIDRVARSKTIADSEKFLCVLTKSAVVVEKRSANSLWLIN